MVSRTYFLCTCGTYQVAGWHRCNTKTELLLSCCSAGLGKSLGRSGGQKNNNRPHQQMISLISLNNENFLELKLFSFIFFHVSAPMATEVDVRVDDRQQPGKTKHLDYLSITKLCSHLSRSEVETL